MFYTSASSAEAFRQIVRERQFNRLAKKLFDYLERRSVKLGCMQFLFETENGFQSWIFTPGWLGDKLAENLSRGLGDAIRFTDPRQTDLCGARNGNRLCGLERDHLGDHVSFHSSGALRKWERVN